MGSTVFGPIRQTFVPTYRILNTSSRFFDLSFRGDQLTGNKIMPCTKPVFRSDLFDRSLLIVKLQSIKIIVRNGLGKGLGNGFQRLNLVSTTTPAIAAPMTPAKMYMMFMSTSSKVGFTWMLPETVPLP